MNFPISRKILDCIKIVPDLAGIYLYYHANGELIYVGKATSLKNRVRSYFIGKKTIRPIEQMLHEIADIKWKTTDSVLEAVILEAVYIKKFQPKYNVLGKDNKSWNYITISNDAYPLVGTLRQHELHQNKKEFRAVFGPYPGLNTREVMKILRRLFYFSTCQKNSLFKTQKLKAIKPCFYYQLGQCLGVCTNEISAREYNKKVIRPLVLFLDGKKQSVIRTFERAMKQASTSQEYEEAGRLRNQLRALNAIQDVALINKDFFSFDMATSTSLGTSQDKPFNFFDLEQKNETKNIRIEGYDISNLGTTGKVGSMVVFNSREPLKSQYRKFKIRTVVGQSDVDCLDEVIRRRLHHTEWPYPNIFLIDGGAPQVNRVVKILQELKIAIPVVGIAKGPERKRNDFYFPSTGSTSLTTSPLGTSGNKERAVVQWVSQNQALLISVRDEAHRFAITFQRSLRKLK
ncbi:MAG: hypothetical protein A2821_00645 [Candidatus Magasanikbacteria bacterium RIFCSPHIGHO2_01_FULL_41_23]|uniref:Excinuclease ABC subunit C n=1 Tax=Candidatus Magasanikbacteria bacterium RIFCSPLOWO2_01_FULL_40_15 TaxID=1798686 RepID=A0A1F6N0U6_9BACT|nr:MAG: hypothetical protein A2821_00645 [Candidatus Magasanikbacteria bacterium RIFCSPHIGHO2_01_FULL_41_23]OGH74683.1 MAG: hypothetical protein A3F22_02000 [Candidatus Magasanikbacteria bacterium RIFCSPHIGHO2_12_FULL_41_16]OGH77398.1 MAG: hypothetical protein A2983_01700 [Candidatus Magasanikbacteria bacterium RIFCSPLOWO2_01_FULL_40_15]